MALRYIFLDGDGFPNGSYEIPDTVIGDLRASMVAEVESRDGAKTSVPIPVSNKGPLYEKARWDGAKWVEGMAYYLDSVRAKAKNRVDARVEEILEVLSPVSRRSLYTRKAEEARAWMATPSAPTPTLDAEVTSVLESKAELLKKVLDRDALYWKEVRRTEGLRRKAKQDIEQAKTLPEIQKIETDFIASLRLA